MANKQRDNDDLGHKITLGSKEDETVRTLTIHTMASNVFSSNTRAHQHASHTEMMCEEFDESEVTFAEVEASNTQENHTQWQHNKFSIINKIKRKKRSLPISIPKNISSSRNVESDLFEDDYEDEIIVPPHILLMRRVLRDVTYSICRGYGKALKGRELNQMRNLIFRFTGFLET
ncbi:hypothetical protein L2E82_14842 [Cichorium intybus]|uniref:Uncharacterized protein n=1 Tax=Cichorium intybus TaxID=13427 RepID=A0ACB9F1Q8_CICIN|nr:hypothetical protein L2E82_14842 [Cichorium intybus]